MDTKATLTDSPKYIRRTQGLHRLQPKPRIHTHVVLPESLQLVIKRILFWYLQPRYRLPWVFLWIPDLARVLHWLILEVLTELELEEILRVVLGVEIAQPLAQNIRFVLLGLNGLVVELLLGLS